MKLWQGAGRVRWVLFGVYVVVIALSCANVMVTVPLWRNNLSLWTWASQSALESSSVWANLAAAHQEYGELDEAVFAAKKSLSIPGDNATRASALVTLGNVESLRGDLDGAANFYLKSFSESKTNPGALINMISALTRMGEYGSAKWYIDTAVGYKGVVDEPYFYFNCGVYYLAVGDRVRAKDSFYMAIKMIDESRRSELQKIAEDFLMGRRNIKDSSRI